MLAEYLLDNGADINYHKPDMVFPYASTPVTEAARRGDLEMVRFLVERGADVTIADKYGDRPYTLAVQSKNQEMTDYVRALEPEDWHNEQEKARQLKPYKLPAAMAEYLKTGPLRLEFPEYELTKWAELYSYMDVLRESSKNKTYGIGKYSRSTLYKRGTARRRAESSGFKLRHAAMFYAAGCRVKPGMTKCQSLL